MNIKMRGKRVGVEKVGKSTKKDAFLAMPDDSSSVGIIRFIGDALTDTDLKVGDKIHFGKNRHEIKIEGKDILVMDEDNVYAVVNE